MYLFLSFFQLTELNIDPAEIVTIKELLEKDSEASVLTLMGTVKEDEMTPVKVDGVSNEEKPEKRESVPKSSSEKVCVDTSVEKRAVSKEISTPHTESSVNVFVPCEESQNDTPVIRVATKRGRPRKIPETPQLPSES